VESVIIDKGLDEANWVIAVIDLLSLITKLPSQHFCLKKNSTGDVVGIKLNGLVRDFALNVIANAPCFIKRKYPYHDSDPGVELFFKFVTQNNELRYRARQGFCGLTKEEAVKTCSLLNAFVFEIRSELVSDEFREKTRACRRAAEKNYLSAEDYISSMFSMYSRLLVVRVDLSYPADNGGEGVSGRSIGAKETRGHRVDFFNNLRRSTIATNLVGYLWKMEYGLKKGFHYHCMFFFDGATVREDVVYGRLIGDLWGDVIGYKGMYWNCNADKDKYQYLGIGMIHNADAEMRDGLSRAANYLTKPNYYLYLSNHVFGRVFGKGVLRIKKKRGGRPRKIMFIANSLAV